MAGIGEPVTNEIAGFLQLRCISAVPKKLTPTQGIEARGNSARRAKETPAPQQVAPQFDHLVGVGEEPTGSSASSSGSLSIGGIVRS
jgi:hypothetical protein